MRGRTDARRPASDLDERWMASLSYLCILIPLFSERKLTTFERFHARQGMKLLLAAVLANALAVAMPHPIRYAVLSLVNFAALGLMLLGLTHAAKGTAKPLPLLNRNRS